MLESITPLILTHNEAPNIGRTLEQLRWARDIVVIDSYSDDDTLEIISAFPQVRAYQRGFDSHSNQWTFGLRETGITSEWVLALDADYILTDELLAEVRALSPSPEINGYRTKFVYCINGKRLISGIYPPAVALYRRTHASYRQDGHTHKLVLEGRTDDLLSPILHDDRKPFSRWLEAQSRYTKLEADKLLSAVPGSLSWTDRIRCWRVVAPAAMLLYCLIVRGGIFDGWAGFYYAFQRALAELMLSLYLIDHDLTASERRAQGPNQTPINAERPPMNTDKMDHKETDAQRPLPGSVVSKSA
jgi:glycosyltransferase involved in cell wall biosynthesis